MKNLKRTNFAAAVPNSDPDDSYKVLLSKKHPLNEFGLATNIALELHKSAKNPEELIQKLKDEENNQISDKDAKVKIVLCIHDSEDIPGIIDIADKFISFFTVQRQK